MTMEEQQTDQKDEIEEGPHVIAEYFLGQELGRKAVKLGI